MDHTVQESVAEGDVVLQRESASSISMASVIGMGNSEPEDNDSCLAVYLLLP